MRFLLCFIFIVVQTCIIILVIEPLEFGADFFWHLRIGLDWINTQLSPFVDHYNIIYDGKPYKHLSPYLFQIFIGGIYKLVGLNHTLYVLESFLFVSLILLMLYFGLKNKLKIESIFLGISLLVFIILYRIIPRPEIFAYIFIVYDIFLIEKLRKSYSKALILKICLVQMLWTNIHSTSFMGYIIFGSYVIEQLFFTYTLKLPKKKYFEWCFLGTSFLLTGFVNPYFSHPILVSLNFSNGWQKIITEHEPQNFNNEYYIALFTITILALVLSVKTKRIYSLVSSIIFLYGCFLVNKIFTFYFTMLVPILMISFDSIYSKALSSKSISKLRLSSLCWVLVFLILSLQYLFFDYIQKIKGNLFHLSLNMPVEALDYLDKKKIGTGKIYNNYNAGGYVIYRTPIGVKSIIDGRTNLLFSLQETKSIISAATDPRKLYELDKEYNFDYAVANYNTYNSNFENILRTGIFKLKYAGLFSSFLTKEDNNFVAARLSVIAPSCLDKTWSKQIKKELKNTKIDHLEIDLMYKLLNFFDGFLESNNQAKYLFSFEIRPVSTIYEVRALAAMSARLELYSTALTFYKLPNPFYIGLRDRVYILFLIAKSELFEENEGKIKRIVKSLKFIQRELSTYEKKYLYDLLLVFKENGIESKPINYIFNKYKKAFKHQPKLNLEDNYFKYKCDKDSELEFVGT